ncbi:hypothetical protein H2199_003552 [Coniosporium tulheliwenetii]|uniref:Uncharacterized protein n=1 Tax=Coniosporium tulheliwenetii TaxID=3383036 RepID=A0ACC2ZA80_9PEZI|nr:hypothetical protein H2199_003552 [Cladosporium sp. JES 115]
MPALRRLGGGYLDPYVALDVPVVVELGYRAPIGLLTPNVTPVHTVVDNRLAVYDPGYAVDDIGPLDRPTRTARGALVAGPGVGLVERRGRLLRLDKLLTPRSLKNTKKRSLLNRLLLRNGPLLLSELHPLGRLRPLDWLTQADRLGEPEMVDGVGGAAMGLLGEVVEAISAVGSAEDIETCAILCGTYLITVLF